MKKLFLSFVCIIAAGWMLTTQAKTWRVNNAPGVNADFKTLDAAMAGITAGDTIYVEGSPDAYPLAEIKKKITIIGTGYFLTENPNTLEYKMSAKIQSVTIAADAAGSVFEGLEFVQGNGFMIKANNVTIRRCNFNFIRFDGGDIYNSVITQCYITSDVGATSWGRCFNALFCNNIFTSNGMNTLAGLNNSTIENNTFTAPSSYSNVSFIGGTKACVIRNNIINSYLSSSNTDATERGNVSAATSDYKSTGASTDGKWQLTDNAPARTGGVNGVQCGAFGGATPYVLSGLPDVPRVYAIDAPTAASSASGLNVNIKVATEK